MSISFEFALCLAVQLLTAGICIGVYKSTIAFMKEQIVELKVDMKKYNNVLERMIKVESSTKSAHHRLDKLEKS